MFYNQMFFQLVKRNSRRNRKENGLFFASLLISIIAFYIILSLAHQDVMLFLAKMESDAVNRLMSLIPAFYGASLVILFFLIYYAGKFQLERRRHEFGVCLMMGMRRSRLFAMLLAEDVRNSILAILIGIPAGVLLCELISLVTAKCVGLGIIGHRFSFSIQAAFWTAAGFLLIKLAAFLILSGRITRQEIASLLTDTPEGTKKQLPAPVYAAALAGGLLSLAGAYTMAIRGFSWRRMPQMGLTVGLGLFGTLLAFFGLRFLIGYFAEHAKKDQRLHVFNFRQIQETVIYRSTSLAVSSLLILSSLACFGSGTAIAYYYGQSETHILDYTFVEEWADDSVAASGSMMDTVKSTLAAYNLDGQFAHLFEMKIGRIQTTGSYGHAFQMDSVQSAIAGMGPSDAKRVLLNNLSYADTPHLIPVSCYNKLLAIAGMPLLELKGQEAAVYMDLGTATQAQIRLMDQVLADRPKVLLNKDAYHLTGAVQTARVTTDRSITLSFALILPDDAFAHYTKDEYSVYINGVLNLPNKSGSLLAAIADTNSLLDQTGLPYESYLQNMGRRLFYVVAASYITIYLAVIFLIIANTFIGVQFLMGQQKTGRRYQTLIRLGATYEILCQSLQKQVLWYFGIPSVIAAISSLFGVRALFRGLLSYDMQDNILQLLFISAAMILLLCVVEYVYMAVVKQISRKYLLTLMTPTREE